MKPRYTIAILLVILTVGCAGLQKGCMKMNNSNFGSDWIVVQYASDGHPFHCWLLHNAVVESSEGGNVEWVQNGHLLHLTGWENRVQVNGNSFEEAGKMIGVESSKCGMGAYPKQ